ncbi:prenyltransferase/squalene oxidase repeat-containing protein [Jeotgalibacillus proteolyticus]|uniref:terpene cyclase/mutase family protein n=1 Tax=Jeotgalibacillus proteolyticus TaxID=2082395 RepID=UPI003CE994F7
MQSQVDETIGQLIKEIETHQAPDGSFRFCFENSLMSDTNMMLLLKTLTGDDHLIQELGGRVASLQHPEGYWSLYPGDNGSLSATIEAYFALLYTGFWTKTEEAAQKAAHFILAQGGLGSAHSMTKIMLAIHGQYPWPNLMHLPVHFILFPASSPISFYDFSSYARVHMGPILLLTDSRFQLSDKDIPDMSRFIVRNLPKPENEQSRSLLSGIYQAASTIAGLPHLVHQQARQRLVTYMLQRIEGDGTLYSYVSSTFYMIYALLSAGYSKQHPLIQKAVSGLKTHRCRTDNGWHIQNSTSTVWDTALLTHALKDTSFPMQKRTKAEAYLLKSQHDKYGDWILTAKDASPGGWGFSDSNTIHPDVDDTTAALRALSPGTSSDLFKEPFNRGLNWVLAMQNEDGGWPAFERGKTNQLLTFVPMDGASHAAIDPSTADLTGRTLEFLSSEARLPFQHSAIQQAIRWLKKNQQTDGSWYGKWGISFLYGTWAAVTGLSAAGLNEKDSALKKAVSFIEQVQNKDGGWGESCLSDQEMQYVPLDSSTPSQTAWALDALLSVHQQKTPAIERGIQSLLRQLKTKNWTYRYPTGAGLPGNFYVYYHSYNYIWPLIVLKKYASL